MPVKRSTQRKIDQVIQAFVKFQDQLAPLDAALSMMVNGLMELKRTGNVSDQMIEGADAARKLLVKLPQAADELTKVGPLMEMIMAEITGEEL
jgi:hypothetical protein